MTAANHPEWSVAGSDKGRDEGGLVLPFPPGGRDGQRRSDARWRFAASVRWVSAAEGEWLRRELAGVLRDLLVWAQEDMVGDEADSSGEERAA